MECERNAWRISCAAGYVLGQRRVDGRAFRRMFPESLRLLDQFIIERKVGRHAWAHLHNGTHKILQSRSPGCNGGGLQAAAGNANSPGTPGSHREARSVSSNPGFIGLLSRRRVRALPCGFDSRSRQHHWRSCRLNPGDSADHAEFEGQVEKREWSSENDWPRASASPATLSAPRSS